MAELAPIVLFVYKRAEHAARTLAALAANPEATESDLVVYADGPKGDADRAEVAATRAVVRGASGFRSFRIVEREANVGLARNVVDGVGAVMAECGRAIVVEDDIEASPSFLRFMNAGLDLYADDDRVASIHGYSYPCASPLPDTFFLRGADCWGWAAWARSWKVYEGDAGRLLDGLKSCPWRREFDFDGAYPYRRMLVDAGAGHVSSWAVRWYASTFLAGMYTLYPGRSLVRNIGNDGTGTNSVVTERYEVACAKSCPAVVHQPVETDQAAYRAFREYFLSLRPSVPVRLLRRIRDSIRH